MKSLNPEKSRKQKIELGKNLMSGKTSLGEVLMPKVYVVYSSVKEPEKLFYEDGRLLTEEEKCRTEAEAKPRNVIWINVVDV